MSVTNFIPTIWSAKLLETLDKAHVYGNLVNRDYEGEIKNAGDKVRINTIGPVSIGDYTSNSDMLDPEELSGTQQELVIDQAKYFNFQIDDIDNAQTNPKLLESGVERAGYGLADVSDRFIAGLYTGVAASNIIGSDASPIVATKADAYDYLVDLGVMLDEANVPSVGRWVVIPAFYHGLIQKDERFIGTGSANSDVIKRTGFIGEVNGFSVYKSNNVPNTAGANYKIMAGYNGAISFAEQILKTEAYRMEKRFADAVKGLHVYGAKLTRPDGIAVLTVNKA